MKYNFETLLQKEKIQESDLSVSLRKKIADLRKLANAIETEEPKLQGGNLSVSKEKQLREKIEAGKATLPQMDTELVAGINKWIPNRVKYAAAAERLAGARTNKAAGGTTEGGTATPAASPASPSTTPPAPKPERIRKETTTPVPAEEKKGIGVWGWVLLLAGAATLGVVGVQVVRTWQSRRA